MKTLFAGWPETEEGRAHRAADPFSLQVGKHVTVSRPGPDAPWAATYLGQRGPFDLAEGDPPEVVEKMKRYHAMRVPGTLIEFQVTPEEEAYARAAWPALQESATPHSG